jgi:hypothetical protein
MRTSIWSGTSAVIVSFAMIAIAARTSSALQDRPQPPSAPQERPQAPTASPQDRPPTPPAAPQDRSAASEQKITVTGCLTAAPPAPTGTAGATDAKGDPAGSETKFLLTNAAAADSSPSAAGGASANASAAKTYRLIANETALSPHAGKKLELTGTLEDQSSSTSSSSAGSSNSSTAASASNAPRLRVESGKVLSAQCSE